MPKSNIVYFASLPERCGVANDEVYNRMMEIALKAGASGYHMATIGYSRTDKARNMLCKQFMETSDYDNDLLIMLDSDHMHPVDILDRFASHDPALGVVGALAYRRGEPYDPLFFVRDAEGTMRVPAEFERGAIYPCAIVSTSAIAIRRWVLVELLKRGYDYPWFRYEYPVNGGLPSEDMYFGWICERAGISHHCDTSLEIPHLGYRWTGTADFEAWKKAHPANIQNFNSPQAAG